jgi:hypothetical protein
MDQETSETSNEIAGQVNKAVSEFREEASKADIAPIVKDLQRALEEQSQRISTVEDYMQSSVESEKAVFADITRLSNSLGGILETQRGILESLKGLNDNIDTASQQQNTEMSGGAGDDSLGGGVGDDLLMGGNLLSGGGNVTSAMMGGGGYGGGGGAAPSIPKGEMAETLKAGIVERLVSDEELAVDPEKAEMIAEAFVLNFDDESGLDPNVIERAPNVHGTRGKGLYQLTDTDPGVGRRSDYEAIYGDDYSVENQLDFLVHELKTSENSAWSGIKDSETVGEAAGKIVRDFLRPAEQYKIERSNRYSGDKRTTSDFDGVVEKPEPIDGALTPLSLNWVDEELPEGVTEGLNQTTLSDPISGESFPVEFEVENVEGKFITTGPVTLTEDTDLEGVSGSAGDPVEVSAEIAQGLAGQIGATIESSDLEEPDISGGVGDDQISGGVGDDLLMPEKVEADLEEPDISDPDTLTPEEEGASDLEGSEIFESEEEIQAVDLERPTLRSARADLEDSVIIDPDNLAPEEKQAYLEDSVIFDSDTLTLEGETPSGVSRSTADPEESVIFDSNAITPEEEGVADLEPTDISNSGTLIPEVVPTPINLEIEPTVADDISNAEMNVGSPQGQPQQTSVDDYDGGVKPPTSLTEKWANRVGDYYKPHYV